MHRPVVFLAIAVLAAAVMASPGFAKLDRTEATSAAMIQDAYARGEITHDEMILQKAYALYAPWKLREDLTGGLTDKCGTPDAKEIYEALPGLPQAMADEIRGLRARPSCQTYVDTDHFRIHYNTTGTAKILNWPDTTYRDAVMAAAEHTWGREVDTLGFRAPPPDGSDGDGGGGDDRYDIYVINLGPGLYGYTSPSYTHHTGGYPTNAATSYVVIDNDYLGFGYADPTDPMKVTVAHEFNHGCQMAHDYTESTWYMECTAVWCEEQVYDSINDYTQYLASYLSSLYQSIDYCVDNMRWYGSVVWNLFLSEYYDPSVVVDNWYQMESSSPTLDMMNIALINNGTSLEEAYKEFAVWCWFTGSRNDGTHFEEASSWPTTTIMRGHNSYPILISGPTPGWEPDRYGCNYVQFNNVVGDEDGLLVSYDGPQLLSVANAAFLNYKTTTGQYHEYGEIPLNPWGVGDLTVEGWDGMQFVGLVIVNCDGGTNNMTYSYDAQPVETGTHETYAFGLKNASPNPFVETTSIAYSVPTGGGFVEITIYDVKGRVVRNLVSDRMEEGVGHAMWDGLDDTGRHVASGVYFARLNIDGLTASGKLMALK
jgi:hypothetical protein